MKQTISLGAQVSRKFHYETRLAAALAGLTVSAYLKKAIEEFNAKVLNETSIDEVNFRPESRAREVIDQSFEFAATAVKKGEQR